MDTPPYPRYLLAYMHNTTLAVGDTFTAWPPHVTLIPHMTNIEEDALYATIKTTAAQTAGPIHVAGGQYAKYGPEGNIHVTTLAPQTQLQQLHTRLLDALTQTGGTLLDDTYTGTQYSAHMTDTETHQLKVGEHVTVDNITVVKQTPKLKQVTWHQILQTH